MASRDTKLKQVVEVIKRELKPKRLFLFGSRAAGKATKESDYDFVAVVPKKRGKRMDNWERANNKIFDECGVSADVFVYSEKEFEDWKDEFSSIPETALNTGREIKL
jgi:predicted nucleotidyltransferase